MKLSKLFCTVLLAGALAVIGCGDSGGSSGGSGGATGTGGSGGSTGEPCTVDDCATNNALRQACLMIYEPCIATGQTDAQCRALAEPTNCRGEL